MTTKRQFLLSGISLIGVAAIASAFTARRATGAAPAETFEVTKTADEWRKQLTPEQFSILREEGTEAPGTSPLLEEHRKGTFACAACDLPLFASDKKFDSGTGWPSFWRRSRCGRLQARTRASSWCAPRSTAAVAAAISAMCSTTARRRPASATASTAWRCSSIRRRPDPRVPLEPRRDGDRKHDRHGAGAAGDPEGDHRRCRRVRSGSCAAGLRASSARLWLPVLRPLSPIRA